MNLALTKTSYSAKCICDHKLRSWKQTEPWLHWCCACLWKAVWYGRIHDHMFYLLCVLLSLAPASRMASASERRDKRACKREAGSMLRLPVVLGRINELAEVGDDVVL
jgi:hypothetical protein